MSSYIPKKSLHLLKGNKVYVFHGLKGKWIRDRATYMEDATSIGDDYIVLDSNTQHKINLTLYGEGWKLRYIVE